MKCSFCSKDTSLVYEVVGYVGTYLACESCFNDGDSNDGSDLSWMGNDDDPACSKCHMPLRIITNVHDGKCVDIVACLVRQQILQEGPIHILSPEGVTRVERIRRAEA